MTGPNPTVYVITDASSPHTTNSAAPVSTLARRLRLCRRAMLALAVLLVARWLLAEAFDGWRWLIGPLLLAWTCWPHLRWLRHVVVLLAGALDALATAYLAMPRLAYLLQRFTQIVRDTRREENP
ncbi:hypothetical protein ACIBKY_55140 [Nonomuraea sp. NPDC050394]|uniref:hypothetical protein n=1 Tax=Nonomuraea sp. NPDC050394 TaxID=3364363 RepID=UPI0037BDEE77